MKRTRRQDPLGDYLSDATERLRGDRWSPALDVFETEKAIVVRVELAGVEREDVRVSVDGDRLHIRGVRRPPEDQAVQRLHQMEINFGPFERTLRIGIPFERDGVSAHLADGYLSVTLPKRSKSRVRVEIDG